MSRKRDSVRRQTSGDNKRTTLINISANPKFVQGQMKMETFVHSLELDDDKQIKDID